MRSVLPLIFVMAGVASPQAPTAPPQQADIYAIYSLMVSSYTEANKELVLAIYQTTRPAMTPGAGRSYPCVEPQAQQASRWPEILADFNARIGTPVPIVRDLTIARPYMLITPDDGSAFAATRPGPKPPSTTPAPPLDPKLQDIIHVFYLSDVYFSKDRTLALTGIANYCGPLCAKGEWKIFEKVSGKWVEVRPARSCMVVA